MIHNAELLHFEALEKRPEKIPAVLTTSSRMLKMQQIFNGLRNGLLGVQVENPIAIQIGKNMQCDKAK